MKSSHTITKEFTMSRGNTKTNVVLICFISLVVFSCFVDFANAAKYIKFPPLLNVGTEEQKRFQQILIPEVAVLYSAKVPDNKKYIKFPPNLHVGDEKTKTPANHYHRGCSYITRCRKELP
ncbi:uncharacterized protein LOC132034763 [Lycium ferocissimum]|uniref:uncharacterized protein LOC132034763 n=1 Tax=Lycium ferocissimum TaxID=112874 RepID=UPI002815036A|nr:uncharacterized protein LOC132034763 [Lycium ferocissimum]